MREYCGFYGETAAERLTVALKEGNGFSAVICGNIAIAKQVKSLLHAFGRTDIPIVSCDCSSAAPEAVSDIPRIVVDDIELGRRALIGLLDLIAGKRKQIHETCAVKLVIGA